MIEANKRLRSFNPAMRDMFKQNVDIINESLMEVELTEQEEKTLLWLCENDIGTVQNIASVLQKVRVSESGTKDNI